VREVIAEIKRVGIPIKVDFIIGAPTEAEEDLKMIIEFIKETKVNDIFLYFLKYYPGSKAIQFALDNGYITKDEYEIYQEGMEEAYQVIPDRFKGKTREFYAKYNKLIRDAAGSKFNLANEFDYLLEEEVECQKK